MGRCGNELLWRIAMLGWFGLGSMSTVVASPPAAHKGMVHLDRHLDLDLHPPAATMGVAAEKKPSEAFPSSLHRHSLGARESTDLPSMGTQSRVPNRVQEFARRVRREGLPVARLWENQSALVSLGLNNKGKPGLWVIQKIH
jgi:hypothetical protein